MFRITAVFVVASACLLGQTSTNSSDSGPKKAVMQVGDVAGFGPIGITTAMVAPMATVTGAPYSAETVTERIQTLADGNRIVQSTTGSVARDSKGRVRRDGGLSGLESDTGDAPHLVMITDPVASVNWALDPQTKTARKMPPLPPPPPPLQNEKTWFYATSSGSGEPHVQVLTKTEPISDANLSKTDLGTQNMEGVMAKGTRITRTIPAGAIGNEQPIVITSETWYSPDLKVLVLSKTDDPRMGETTYKLTNIQRSEPAASLFQVPEDYTVKDEPGNKFFFREAPKNP